MGSFGSESLLTLADNLFFFRYETSHISKIRFVVGMLIPKINMPADKIYCPHPFLLLGQELRHLPHPVDVALARRDELVRAVVEVEHPTRPETDKILEMAQTDEERRHLAAEFGNAGGQCALDPLEFSAGLEYILQIEIEARQVADAYSRLRHWLKHRCIRYKSAIEVSDKIRPFRLPLVIKLPL